MSTQLVLRKMPTKHMIPEKIPEKTHDECLRLCIEKHSDKIRLEKRFADRGKLAVEIEKKKKMKKAHDQREPEDLPD